MKRAILAALLAVLTGGGALAQEFDDCGIRVVNTPSIVYEGVGAATAKEAKQKLTADLYLSRKITAQEERIDAQEKQIAQLKWSVDKLKLQVEGLKRASIKHGANTRDIVKWGEGVDKQLDAR